MDLALSLLTALCEGRNQEAEEVVQRSQAEGVAVVAAAAYPEVRRNQVEEGKVQERTYAAAEAEGEGEEGP